MLRAVRQRSGESKRFEGWFRGSKCKREEILMQRAPLRIPSNWVWNRRKTQPRTAANFFLGMLRAVPA
eukprot:14559724-Alexandrium_andersonii.AAC.1